MAGIDAKKVYLPGPDQSSTVGAVATAPEGTSAPSDARSALGADWDTSGYIDENGLTMSLSRSTTAIKDWSQATVRNAITEFTGTLSFSFLQFDQFAAETVFGASNVTISPADSDNGEVIAVGIGAELPPIQSFCFNMKDGDARIRVYVPRGQVTEVGDVTFVPGAGNVYPVTVTCYDDADFGSNLAIFYDDGQIEDASA